MRSKFATLFILLIASTLISAARSNSTSAVDGKLYTSYMTGNMNDWVAVIKSLESEYAKSPSADLSYSILIAQYGYIGYLIGIKDSKQARLYLARAEERAEAIIKTQPTNADALAVKAALLAYHIALSPYKAPYIGPRSMAIIDEALALNPNSAQAIMEKANAAHYAPSMFGGNPTEAARLYLRAIALFEGRNNGNAPKSWLYLNAYAQLALAYQKAKLYDQAEITFKQILKIAPDFKWVRDELYPNFRKMKR